MQLPCSGRGWDEMPVGADEYKNGAGLELIFAPASPETGSAK